MIVNKLKCLLVSALAISLLGGCSGKQTEDVAVQESNKPKYIKPGADIVISGPQLVELEENGTTHVKVIFSTNKKQGRVNIRALEHEGYELGQDNWSLNIGEGELAIDVPVVTMQPGRYYLMLNMELIAEGQKQSRVQGITLQVGEPQADAEKSSNSSGGRRFMEAEETVQ